MGSLLLLLFWLPPTAKLPQQWYIKNYDRGHVKVRLSAGPGHHLNHIEFQARVRGGTAEKKNHSSVQHENRNLPTIKYRHSPLHLKPQTSNLKPQTSNLKK
jgi:hypothetical protein